MTQAGPDCERTERLFFILVGLPVFAKISAGCEAKSLRDWRFCLDGARERAAEHYHGVVNLYRIFEQLAMGADDKQLELVRPPCRSHAVARHKLPTTDSSSRY
eukprot:2955696-Amphidinium_carterae.1